VDDGAAGADHHAIGNRHAGPDKYIRSDPDLRADPDPGAANGEVGLQVIVVAGAHIGFLRNHRMGTDIDLAQAIQRYVVADPGVVANRDFPGVGDAYRGPDNRTFADLRSEQSEQAATPAVHNLGRAAEQQGVDQPPQLHKPARPAAKAGRHGKTRQILIPKHGWLARGFGGFCFGRPADIAHVGYTTAASSCSWNHA